MIRLPYDLVVVDLETNGQDGPEARIVEFGAAVFRADGSIGDRITQVFDGRPMGNRPSLFTDQDLVGKPLFGEFAPKFPRWCWDRSRNFVLASWNPLGDIPLLEREFDRAAAKFPFPKKAFCVRSMAFEHLWKSNRYVASSGIDKTLRMMGLEYDGTLHRAGDDAYNVTRILQGIFGFTDQVKETA